MAMFLYTSDCECIPFPEEDFDSFVARGLLKKSVSEKVKFIGQGQATILRVLYARVEEEWRINAFLLVQSTYDALGGFRPDLERIIGSLLGYSVKEIEAFITLHAKN